MEKTAAEARSSQDQNGNMAADCATFTEEVTSPHTKVPYFTHSVAFRIEWWADPLFRVRVVVLYLT